MHIDFTVLGKSVQISQFVVFIVVSLQEFSSTVRCERKVHKRSYSNLLHMVCIRMRRNRSKSHRDMCKCKALQAQIELTTEDQPLVLELPLRKPRWQQIRTVTKTRNNTRFILINYVFTTIA